MSLELLDLREGTDSAEMQWSCRKALVVLRAVVRGQAMPDTSLIAASARRS